MRRKPYWSKRVKFLPAALLFGLIVIVCFTQLQLTAANVKSQFAAAEASKEEQEKIARACENAKQKAAQERQVDHRKPERRTFSFSDDFRDDCVAAVVKRGVLEADLGKAESYECVGKMSRMTETQQGVEYLSYANRANKPGVCSVLICQQGVRCVAAGNVPAMDYSKMRNLAFPRSSLHKEFQNNNNLETFNLRESGRGATNFDTLKEYEGLLRSFGCGSESGCANQGQQERFKQYETDGYQKFDQFLKSIDDPDDAASLRHPEVALNNSLGDTRNLRASSGGGDGGLAARYQGWATSLSTFASQGLFGGGGVVSTGRLCLFGFCLLPY